MHLAVQALSFASSQACHWNKETNISNKLNIVKIPNWQEADQLAIYKASPRIWTRDYRETNPASSRVEALKAGPPNYNTSVLNHSATLPPRCQARRGKHETRVKREKTCNRCQAWGIVLAVPSAGLTEGEQRQNTTVSRWSIRGCNATFIKPVGELRKLRTKEEIL